MCQKWSDVLQMIGWGGGREFESKVVWVSSCVKWFQSAVLMLGEHTRSYPVLNWARVTFWGTEPQYGEKCWTKKSSPAKPPNIRMPWFNLSFPQENEFDNNFFWPCLSFDVGRTGVGFAVGRGGDNGAAMINTQLQGRGGKKIAYFC